MKAAAQAAACERVPLTSDDAVGDDPVFKSHQRAQPTQNALDRQLAVFGVPLPLLLFIFFWILVNGVIHVTGDAYLRAGVGCDGALREGRWSGSAHCPDADLVIASGTWVGANLNSLHIVVHLVTGPLFGALADTHGRLLVIGLSVGTMLASEVARAFAAGLAAEFDSPSTPDDASTLSALRDEWSVVEPELFGIGDGHAPAAKLLYPLSLVLSGAVLGGLSATGAAVSALCNDFCHAAASQPHRVARMYTLLGAVHGVSGVGGMLLGVRLLACNLTDYTLPTAALALLLLLVPLPLLLVHEPSHTSHAARTRHTGSTSLTNHTGLTCPPAANPTPANAVHGGARLCACPPPDGGVLCRGATSGACERDASERGTRESGPCERGPSEHSTTERAASEHGTAHAWPSVLALAQSVAALWRSSSFLRLYCLSSALQVGGIAGYGALLPPVSLSVLHWPQGMYEQRLLLSAVPSTLASLALVNGRVLPAIGAAAVLRVSMLCLLLGWAVLLTMAWLGAIAIYVGAALLGLAAGALPAGGVLLAERFQPYELATVFSLLSSASSLALALALPAFAAAYEPSPSPSVALPIASFVLVAAGAWLLAYALEPPPG